MGHCVDRGPAGIRILIVFVVLAFPFAFLMDTHRVSICRTSALPGECGPHPPCEEAGRTADGLPGLPYDRAKSTSGTTVGPEGNEAGMGMRAIACVCEHTGKL